MILFCFKDLEMLKERGIMSMLTKFKRALNIGRPPNIVNLFPESQAFIVSGKAIDRGLLKKGQAMTIASNGRNYMVIRGTLMAAQKANAAVIIEIAKSEGGSVSYCAINFWNIARQVDSIMNEMGISIPVAIHADHYAIKSEIDIKKAKIEIPSMFKAGITSVAIDASYLSDTDNLLVSIDLNSLIPRWSGLETEIGEIKGKEGLSTVNEALFLIKGLNAHNIFPDWIALNNGTVHGIQDLDVGIQVELTKQIHDALTPYYVSGAQHGTSGNSVACLKRVAAETRTTKANVATALQMISWGIKVNEYGNVEFDQDGELQKIVDKGVDSAVWAEMKMYVKRKSFKIRDWKKLSLIFEDKLLSQPEVVRNRMVNDICDFVYWLLVEVFNAVDSATFVIDAILDANSYDVGPKVNCIENPVNWTKDMIKLKGTCL